MMRRGKPFVLGCVLVLMVQTAWATITLQSSISFAETEDGAHFSGVVKNVGNKTADDSSIEIVTPFSDASYRVVLGHLDSGITNTWEIAYSHPEGMRRGTFASIIRTHYADPNGFRLHAVQLFPYALGDPADARAPVRLTFKPQMRAIEGTELEGLSALTEIEPLAHSLQCTLSLDANRPHNARMGELRVVLPDSLQAAWEPLSDNPVWTNDLIRTLSPPYPEELRFVITNRSALAGSKLSIGAIFSTQSAENEPATATTAMLQIPIHATPPHLLPDTATTPQQRPLHPAFPLAVLLVFVLEEYWMRHRAGSARAILSGHLVDVLVLAYVYILLAYQLRLNLVFSTGLCLGGDTPAHHYLLSHLEESLRHGRIVSWAPGWWCGFPMYQFYFPLPYLAMAALDLALPTEIAFNVGTVLGIFLTPLTTYAAARMLRLPRPAPALLVLSTIPLLFDTTHVMWGVNIASTLAGMISNSWSFAIFPLALASTLRDVLDQRARLRTVALLSAILLSHFFTSIVLAILLVTLLPFALLSIERPLRLHATRVFLIDGCLAACLIAWWVLPLVATRPWSVDFGDPWDIHLWANLPIYVKVSIVPTLLALPFLLRRKTNPSPALRLTTTLALLQLLIALFLFFAGYSISKVFVNCRLWPFIIHALLTLCALALATALQHARLPILGVLVAFLFTTTYAWNLPNYTRNYAKWNFGGLQARPDAPVYYDLVERLRNTPGRFSADLHPDNVRFASTRAFEALPALSNKPILEGGIVNSALGSLAAYSIQGEVSDAPAGWPLRVIPHTMDVPTGLRHLELLGVRHFLARSRRVQDGIEADPAWSLVHDYGRWRLYENPSVDGSLVHAYPQGMPCLTTNDFQGAIIQWLNTPSLASIPHFILAPNDPAPPSYTPNEAPAQPHPVPCKTSFNRIQFFTPYLGVPHLIAVSAFPNWRILRGAQHLYNATPGLMAVIPTEPTVELAFAPTRADWIGRILLVLGLLCLIPLTLPRKR